ncbi:1377_t:CDS:2 [Cetraspora pellucida]|uniref:1377_t:CDS:1 n=1 Tax=Cetraspora pellucida TaxID=1433469 RepID=A0ACA9PH35_9GLOM|nr:1377_t:CDS:2 [Cetraspora pellucida]
MSQQQFNEFVEWFITNQKSAPPQAKGLTVQLPVFYRKEKENIATWLLQVDLLYKARKIEDDE